MRWTGALVVTLVVVATGCAAGGRSSDTDSTAATIPAETTTAATTNTTVTTTTVTTATVTTTDGRPSTPAATESPSTAASTTTAAPPPIAPAPIVAPRTACTAVVHIGDSTSVGLMSLSDPARRLDAQYARIGVIDFRPEISGARSIVEHLAGQENALEVAVRQRAAGFHGCWVIAVGTNDAANIATGATQQAAERIDSLISVIGFDPVLWVNASTVTRTGAWAEANMQAWDQALSAAAARYQNIVVYDWASVAEPRWFVSDGIHYNATGNAERSQRIAAALAEVYPA